MVDIFDLVFWFRRAIITAREAGEFDSDFSFNHFPRNCCGDTCYLLAKYLRGYGIDTLYVDGERDGSHAWLAVNDENVKTPKPSSQKWPKELWGTLKRYGVENPSEEMNTTHYVEEDLNEATIIDITADQFSDYDEPVYVGPLDRFHAMFEFRSASPISGLVNDRLRNLYGIIMKHIK